MVRIEAVGIVGAALTAEIGEAEALDAKAAMKKALDEKAATEAATEAAAERRELHTIRNVLLQQTRTVCSSKSASMHWVELASLGYIIQRMIKTK